VYSAVDLTTAPAFPPTTTMNVKSETSLSGPAAAFANELAATGCERQTTNMGANPIALHSIRGRICRSGMTPRPRGIQGNHEMIKKSKRPGKLSGPLRAGIQSS
jgi:hypothetical protein